MPDSAVLDSSVVAAIFLFKDSNSDMAASTIADKRLITLDMSMAEVGNVAWKRVAHFQEDKAITLAALRDCLGFISEACVVVRAGDLTEDAYDIAVEDRIAFYDSLFLAAAEREHAPLLTLDRKLYEKAKGKRDVRLI
jgi:predicted nucleic acid-binding protein